MQKNDYKSLYKLQDEVLNSGAIHDAFYLTGGTALSRFYLHHRYSEDLDFFVNRDKDFINYINKTHENLTDNYILNTAKSVISDDFVRFFVVFDEIALKVEFVNDVGFRVNKPILFQKTKIDCVANILSNKITAIASRNEAKDVFDIINISNNYSFNWIDIFSFAKNKSLINEIDVEQRLRTFSIDMLNNVDWHINTFNKNDLHENLMQLTDDFFLGKDNSLGKDKMSIYEANIKI